MGEYWIPVNFTQREFLHPHRLGCGLKLLEWNFIGSPVRTALTALVRDGRWRWGDDIRAISDYGDEMPLGLDAPAVVVADCVPEGDERELWSYVRAEFRDASRGASEIAHIPYVPPMT